LFDHWNKSLKNLDSLTSDPEMGVNIKCLSQFVQVKREFNDIKETYFEINDFEKNKEETIQSWKEMGETFRVKGNSFAEKWETEYVSMKKHDEKSFRETIAKSLGFSYHKNKSITIQLNPKTYKLDNEIREYKRMDIASEDITSWEMKEIITNFQVLRGNSLKIKQIVGHYNILIARVSENLQPLVFQSKEYIDFVDHFRSNLKSGILQFENPQMSLNFFETLLKKLNGLKNKIDNTEGSFDYQKFEIRKLKNYNLVTVEDFKLWKSKKAKMQSAIKDLATEGNTKNDSSTAQV
jgi:hypothetical protein